MPPYKLFKHYKVVIRNKPAGGTLVDWDMKGESAFATVKGAEGRRVVVARKYPGYDTGILTPGGHIINYNQSRFPHLAELKPANPPKKIRLTPRNPDWQRSGLRPRPAQK